VLEHGIEDRPDFFRIAVRQQLHRALEIGEQDRYLLALTLEYRGGGQDPLGEMLRGVPLRGTEPRLSHAAESCAALVTDHGLCAILAAAPGAQGRRHSAILVQIVEAEKP